MMMRPSPPKGGGEVLEFADLPSWKRGSHASTVHLGDGMRRCDRRIAYSTKPGSSHLVCFAVVSMYSDALAYINLVIHRPESFELAKPSRDVSKRAAWQTLGITNSIGRGYGVGRHKSFLAGQRVSFVYQPGLDKRAFAAVFGQGNSRISCSGRFKALTGEKKNAR